MLKLVPPEYFKPHYTGCKLITAIDLSSYGLKGNLYADYKSHGASMGIAFESASIDINYLMSFTTTDQLIAQQHTRLIRRISKWQVLSAFIAGNTRIHSIKLHYSRRTSQCVKIGVRLDNVGLSDVTDLQPLTVKLEHQMLEYIHWVRKHSLTRINSLLTT